MPLYKRNDAGDYIAVGIHDLRAEYRRSVSSTFRRGAYISTPTAASDLFVAKLSDLEHESFAVLFLDTRHRVLRFEQMFHGTIDGAAVYVREVVKLTLSLNAAACIIGHNHPSGVAEPSGADRAITDRLKAGLALIDVKLLDHLIVTPSSESVSFAKLGYI